MADNEASKAQAKAVAPDPDDLDDLDDVLDEFSASDVKFQKQPAAAASSAPDAAAPSSSAAAPSSSADKLTGAEGEDDAGDDDLDALLSSEFAKELAQGMEALMKELGQGQGAGEGAGQGAAPGAGAVGAEGGMNEEELMRQLEQMMMSGGGLPGEGTGAGSAASGAAGGSATGARGSAKAGAGAGAGAGQPGNFQEAIRATMAKLKESDQSASASSSAGGGGDLAQLLAAMGAGGDGETPELAKMLEGMMEELLSKEILFEPLKELRDKYPAWLSSPEARALSADEQARFQSQSRYVSEIVALFERPDYDGNNKETKKKVSELMNSMQDCGAPPDAIVGDLPPELENLPGGADGENCSVM